MLRLLNFFFNGDIHCFFLLQTSKSAIHRFGLPMPFRFRKHKRNDRWFAHLHIQNGGSKRIWILTYSWTGNFLLAWAGQFTGIKNQTMHRFEQYLKISRHFEYANEQITYHFWLCQNIQNTLSQNIVDK
jgi:hypothetical protein